MTEKETVKKTGQAAGTGASILALSDSEDELRTVREQLGKDHGNVLCTVKESDAVQAFSDDRPRLLIMTFTALEKAEIAYAALCQQCPTIQQGAHLTLLLCKNEEAEAAYALCVNGVFNDYLVNRPLPDPHRLDWSVRQLLVRCNALKESENLSRRLAEVGIDLQRLDEYVSPSLRQGSENNAASLRAIQELSDKFKGHLERFQERLNDPSQQAFKVLDAEALHKQFEALLQESLAPALQEVEGKIKTAADSARALDEGFQSRVAPMKSQAFPAPLPEVLLIDDDETYREIVTAMLESSSIRVITAVDGPSGLAELKRHRPHAILLDHAMPGMTGVEVLRQIKKDIELRDVPVLMLTGVSEREVVHNSLAGGAVGFIVKPSDRETVLAKVRPHLPKTG